MGSSAKTRHTVALVSWNDPEDFYKQKIEYVEDSEGITRYGIIETSIAAVGCTSRGQANRVGRWLLYTEQNQTETVTFKTGLNGALIRPGQIIQISDPTRSGSRRAGRVLGATSTTLTLDQSLSIDPLTHSISVLLPDGTISENDIQSISGSMVTINGTFSTTPASMTVWMISSTAIEPQLFKIISISEAENGTHELVALAHNANKYDAVENDLQLESRTISNLNIIPDAPIGLMITENLYQYASDIRVKATISWNAVGNAAAYLVYYTKDNQNPITLPQTSSNDVEILNAEPGIYTATVVALSALGQK
jgi:predicted phage tail protein